MPDIAVGTAFRRAQMSARTSPPMPSGGDVEGDDFNDEEAFVQMYIGADSIDFAPITPMALDGTRGIDCAPLCLTRLARARHGSRPAETAHQPALF